MVDFQLTHLDLFTGIGGFHLAAEWAGFETIGFSEIEPYCCELLADKWPDIKNYGDVRNTSDFEPLRGRITVLSAGVPCQPASLAGKRRGKEDDRWLWPATLDVVGLVKPAWCIFENPTGIATLREFGGILSRLADLGYEVRMFSVSANSVGAKHKRERVFIVAHSECRNGERRSAGRRGEASFGTCVATDGSSDDAEAMADADEKGLEELQPCEDGYQCSPAIRGGRPDRFRLTEPPLRGTAYGLSHRSHRLKCLGNSVVPQQAFPFFEAIAQIEDASKIALIVR